MKKNLARADRPPPAGKIYNLKRPTRAEKMLRTMEIRRRPGKSTIQIRRPGLTRADPPPPAAKINNPNPLEPAEPEIHNPNPDPGRSAAAGRENPQSKSASVAAVVVVATRESRLCRQ